MLAVGSPLKLEVDATRRHQQAVEIKNQMQAGGTIALQLAYLGNSQ